MPNRKPGTQGTSAVWTLAEQEEGRLRPVSYELLAWGRRLTDKLALRGESTVELCSIVLGEDVDRADLRELTLRGADRVLLVQSPALRHFLVDPSAGVLEHLIRQRQPEIVIAAATSRGRTLMPYLAAKLTTGLTADCTGLDIDPETGNLIQTRPAIGGNVLATIITARHRPQMATVRPHSIKALEHVGTREGELEELKVPGKLLHSRVEWLGLRRIERNDANVQDAEKVVSGGRGLKKAENFALVRELAEKLGGAVGASREAVEREWISYPHQVGLSGKTVTPRLYVAVGISGAIQHLAGMKTAERIVAINTDPEAQIFQVADFGVVGDLFEIVPALIEEIERRKRKAAGNQ